MSTVSSKKLPLPSNRLTAETASQHLSDHLKKTAQFIKILDILIFGFSCLVFLLALWLIGSIVDHWLMPIPQSIRWGLWIAAAVALSWGTISYLFPLLIRRINPAYAAHRIEQLVPEFKNGLISWLELQSRPDLAVPKGIMAAIGYQACRFIGVQEPSATVDTGPLIKRVGIALALIVALAVYAMLSPKSLIESGKRLLLPWRNIPVPTRVQILAVSPGHIELTQSTPLKVEVDLRGLSASDSVVLRYNSLDGQLVNQRVSLQAAVDRVRYVGQVLTGAYGIDHEIHYWIEAGDATSGPYQVRLNPLPSLTVKKVQVDFPKYTRLDSREFPPNTPIEGLEGSLMRVWGTANQQLERAKLVINPELNQQGSIVQASEFLDMQLGQKDISGASRLSSQHKSFCLRGYNLLGDSNIHPVIVPMTVYTDVPPEITLVGPEDRTVRVGPSSRLTLEVRANDVDFGLSKVHLEFRVGVGPSSTKILLENAHLQEQPVLSKILSFPLDVSSLKSRVGDRIRVVATAFDNRHDPITGEFSPNQRQSQPLILEVVPPAESRIPPELEQTGDAESGREVQDPSELNQSESPQPPPRQPESAPSSADQSESGQNGAGQSAAGDPPASTQDDSSGDQSGSGSSSQDKGGDDQSKAESTGGPGSDSQPDSKSTGDKSSSNGGQTANGEPSPDGRQNARKESTSQESTSDQAKAEPEQRSSGQDSGSAADQASQDQASQDQTSQAQSSQDEQTLQKIRDYMDRKGQQGQSEQRSDDGKKENGVSPPGSDAEQPTDSQQPSTDEKTDPNTPSQPGSDPKQSGSQDSGQTDPGQTDPSKTDPGKTDPGKTDPGKTDPGKTDPSKTDPSKTDPSKTDPSKTDPSQTDPGKTDPSKTDPGKTDPGKTDPGQTDPSQTDPSQTDPSQTDPGQAEPPRSDSSQDGSDKSKTDKSEEGKSEEGKSEEGKSEEGKSESGDATTKDPTDASSGDSSDGQPKSDQQSGDQQSGDQQSKGQESPSSDPSLGAEESAGDGGDNSASQQPGAAGTEASQQSTDSQDSESRDASDSSGAAPGRGSNGGSRAGSGMGSGDDGAGTASDPSLAQQATDLALEYLERQREQPDPELLKELNWTTEDLKKFLDRYQSARTLSAQAEPLDASDREMKRLQLETQQTPAIGPSGQADDYRQQLDSGGRARPPERLRRQIEQFQKALQQGR
jgi:collagen type III alpha